jgi:hypothetical protein
MKLNKDIPENLDKEHFNELNDDNQSWLGKIVFKVVHESSSEDLTIFVIGIFLLILGLYMSGVFGAGIMTGLISAVGFIALLVKLRTSYPPMWNWVLQNETKMDFITSGVCLLMAVSGSVVGLIAAASTGIFLTVWYRILNKFVGPVEGVEQLNPIKTVKEYAQDMFNKFDLYKKNNSNNTASATAH